LRLILLLALVALAPGTAAEVLTQHNDNARTGVNAEETVLTPATVSAASLSASSSPSLLNASGQWPGALYATG
jgi:hypothetical protein